MKIQKSVQSLHMLPGSTAAESSRAFLIKLNGSSFARARTVSTVTPQGFVYMPLIVYRHVF